MSHGSVGYFHGVVEQDRLNQTIYVQWQDHSPGVWILSPSTQYSPPIHEAASSLYLPDFISCDQKIPRRMDPFSVAGSIAGLISLGDVIFRKLYRYTQEVKNAEKEIHTLKNEVAVLNGVLHNVLLVAQDLEADAVLQFSTRTDHVNSCLATLYRLDEKLKKIGLSDKGTLQNAIAKLAWPFKMVDAKEFTEEVRQHRDRLGFALSADSMVVLLQCLSKQDNASKQIADIDTRLREKEAIETRIKLDDEQQRILNQFLVVDPTEPFQTSLRLRHPTTGFWLAENLTFLRWLRGSESHLWLSGIPGAGKTVLSSLIIQECLARATPNRAVAFFYCDYKNAASQSVINIASALAAQLARQNEQSFHLLKVYDNKLHPNRHLKQEPKVEELMELIQKMSTTFEDVRIIVDGLDECGETASEACSVLRTLTLNSPALSLSLLSRDEPDIREELGHSFGEYIEIAAHSKDVEHYVRTEIEERIRRRKLRVKSTTLKDEIVEQLVSRAQGM